MNEPSAVEPENPRRRTGGRMVEVKRRNEGERVVVVVAREVDWRRENEEDGAAVDAIFV